MRRAGRARRGRGLRRALAQLREGAARASRALLRSRALADRLFRRLLPWLEAADLADVRPVGVAADDAAGPWKPCGVNEVLRVTRYEPGGCSATTTRVRALARERSIFTLMLFLNEGFAGGATRRYRDGAEGGGGAAVAERARRGVCTAARLQPRRAPRGRNRRRRPQVHPPHRPRLPPHPRPVRRAGRRALAADEAAAATTATAAREEEASFGASHAAEMAGDVAATQALWDAGVARQLERQRSIPDDDDDDGGGRAARARPPPAARAPSRARARARLRGAPRCVASSSSSACPTACSPRARCSRPRAPSRRGGSVRGGEPAAAPALAADGSDGLRAVLSASAASRAWARRVARGRALAAAVPRALGAARLRRQVAATAAGSRARVAGDAELFGAALRAGERAPGGLGLSEELAFLSDWLALFSNRHVAETAEQALVLDLGTRRARYGVVGCAVAPAALARAPRRGPRRDRPRRGRGRARRVRRRARGRGRLRRRRRGGGPRGVVALPNAAQKRMEASHPHYAGCDSFLEKSWEFGCDDGGDHAALAAPDALARRRQRGGPAARADGRGRAHRHRGRPDGVRPAAPRSPVAARG